MLFIIPRLISAVILLGLLAQNISYADNDPYFAYREVNKKPLDIKAKELKHFAKEEELIRQKLELKLSQRERAILAGLHWILTLADDDANFKFLFNDFMLLMNALRNSNGREHQKEVVEAISKKALKRGLLHLNELYDTEEMAGWHFIGLFPIIVHYPDLEQGYFAFYKRQWPKFSLKKSPTLAEFNETMKDLDYQGIFEVLVSTSFPHYYIKENQTPKVPMPEDKFPQYMKELEKFNYIDYPIKDTQFRNLGYLATHIPLVLTNYGEFPLKDGINTKKAREYIEKSFEKVWELGEFDLFAEYIQCLKMFQPNDSRIKKLEDFIYSLQRSDGSWGSERDFKTNAYTAIHPSGAALMALNQR